MSNPFFKLSYGLYVVSSMDGNNKTGHISNTVFQVSAEPPQITIASSKDNLTTDYITKNKVFSISVLNQNIDLGFIGPWGFQSGSEIDKFEKANYITGKSGAPILLDNTIAWFDCKVTATHDVGSHILFIADVIDEKMVDESSSPLTYDHYREVIKGISPKNSPTYTGEKEIKINEDIENKTRPDNNLGPQYQCTVCGLIYDPVEGDPDSGIAPGTPFEDIPKDWQCPVCGVTKTDFTVIEF